MNTIDFGAYIRPAVITKVKDASVDFKFIDLNSEPTRTVPKPYPYASQSGGIFFGMAEGDVVLVSSGPYETWYIIAILPNATYNTSTQGVPDVLFNQNKYPTLQSGETSIIGNNSQFINVDASGNLSFGNVIGQKSSNFELSKLSQGIFTRTNQLYTFTEAGRTSEGIIRRDLSSVENSNTTDTFNFFDGENYDLLLNDIGRSPQNEVQKRTTQVVKKTVRNPALVEKRELVYEYADIFNVQDFATEVAAVSDIRQKDGSIDISKLKKNITNRNNRRTDTLDLNTNNFNQLIERIQGTVVDIYGNILDINRNIIPVPAATTIKTNTGNDVAGLKFVYDYLRRSVKYHFELNTRKSINTGPVTLDSNTNYAQLSRFSIDIDAEGLIKVNVPSTSETGNIPVLGRFNTQVDANDPDNGAFRANNRVDQELTQFGAQTSNSVFSGQTIQNEDYRPKAKNTNNTTVGTPFHDIFAIANSIFKYGTLKSPNPIQSPNTTVPPLASSINNKILNENDPAYASNVPNAGGRSAHLNLDGSLDLFIGSNTVDRNSVTVDTAGGTLAHFGRDRNGRSLVAQYDGDIIIQIGGMQITTDPRFPIGTLPNDPTAFRAGRAEIHLVQSSDNSTPPTRVLIDENGITFDSQGSIILKANNNIVLDAGGETLINGEAIYFYSTDYDESTGEIFAAEQRQNRDGR